MMKRYVSLFFSSIGIREIFFVFLNFLPSFFLPDYKRARLHQSISSIFSNADVFSYSSARGALGSCLEALDLSDTDEVLLSSFSCLAVPTAVIYAGAKPVYSDVSLNDLNVSLETILEAINPNTKVIVVQHTMGMTFQVEQLKQAIIGKDIIIIEDCALSTGSIIDGLPVGSYGDAAIFSMELSKVISSGWGGVLISNNRLLSTKLKRKYSDARDLNKVKSLRMLFQTIVSSICHLPKIYWIGKYLMMLLFKVGIFQPSTPNSEYSGIVQDDFSSKMPSELIPLALHQWKRLGTVSKKCSDNAIKIKDILTVYGFEPDFIYFNKNGTSSRLPFLVSDPQSFSKFFDDEGVEVGRWFDGPLSPCPEEEIYNYSASAYSNALFLSKHVVNLPCHERLVENDIKKIELLVKKYTEIHKNFLVTSKSVELD